MVRTFVVYESADLQKSQDWQAGCRSPGYSAHCGQLPKSNSCTQWSSNNIANTKAPNPTEIAPSSQTPPHTAVLLLQSPASAMQASEDGFAARAAKLFGSLEGHGAPAGGWSLNTQQGFAAGAEDQDSSADEADDVEAGPQSLPGAAGSDEDEDEYKVCMGLGCGCGVAACARCAGPPSAHVPGVKMAQQVQDRLQHTCNTSSSSSMHSMCMSQQKPRRQPHFDAADAATAAGQGQPGLLCCL